MCPSMQQTIKGSGVGTSQLSQATCPTTLSSCMVLKNATKDRFALSTLLMTQRAGCPWFQTMFKKNRRLVADEPVELEK